MSLQTTSPDTSKLALLLVQAGPRVSFPALLHRAAFRRREKRSSTLVLTEAGCTAIRTASYFYLLADKQTCSLFLKVSIRTQTKPSTPGEHDAQPSFPKTQAKPRTRKSYFLWDWLQLHINSSACRAVLSLTLWRRSRECLWNMTDDSSVLCTVQGQTTKTGARDGLRVRKAVSLSSTFQSVLCFMIALQRMKGTWEEWGWGG